MKKKCDGKHFCKYKVTAKEFGDKCPDVKKALRVGHRCIDSSASTQFQFITSKLLINEYETLREDFAFFCFYAERAKDSYTELYYPMLRFAKLTRFNQPSFEFHA